jgi:hypothetical protein
MSNKEERDWDSQKLILKSAINEKQIIIYRQNEIIYFELSPNTGFLEEIAKYQIEQQIQQQIQQQKIPQQQILEI